MAIHVLCVNNISFEFGGSGWVFFASSLIHLFKDRLADLLCVKEVSLICILVSALQNL